MPGEASATLILAQTAAGSENVIVFQQCNT